MEQGAPLGLFQIRKLFLESQEFRRNENFRMIPKSDI